MAGSSDFLSLPECGQAENLEPWHLLVPTCCTAITSRETYKVTPPSILHTFLDVHVPHRNPNTHRHISRYVNVSPWCWLPVLGGGQVRGEITAPVGSPDSSSSWRTLPWA